MKTYRVRSVEFNNRARSFEVRIAGREREYVVPYGMVRIDGLVDSVEVDPETNGAGFVWTLRDGTEGAILAEDVLWIHRDPEVRHRHLLYDLTVEAQHRQQAQNVSIRSLARMLETSPARVQLLLRPTVYRGKSVKAMLALLSALGAEVDIRVRDAVA